MKKTILILSSLMLMSIIPVKVLAGTLSAGGYVSYSWWDPIYEDYLLLEENPLITGDTTFEMTPQFLYGPSISYALEDWSFSVLFLTGEYHPEADGTIIPGGAYYRASPDIRRYDLDLVASYNMLSFMKIFLGFKYQNYSWDYPQDYGGTIAETSLNFNMAGFALGVSFSYNLVENLYLVCNFSGLYQLGIITDHTEAFIGSVRIVNIDRWGVGNSLGCNVVLSLAYYIEAISTTLSIGGRYQYVYLFETNNPTINNYTHKRYDQFYGVFMTAMYSFDI